METLGLLWLATGPGIAIAVYLFYCDKWEPEPKKMVIKAFLLGALACIPSIYYEEQFDAIFGFEGIWENPAAHPLWHKAVSAFFGVALIEELSKFLFLKGFIYDDREFNEPFDGIIYGGIIGCGFATFENIFYVFQSGYSVGILRIFTAIPAHAFNGMLMGYFFGIAKFSPNPLSHLIPGFILVFVLHGAYDSAALADDPLWSWLMLFVILGISIYLGLRAKRELKKHSKWLEFSTQEFFLQTDKEKITPLRLKNIRDSLSGGSLALDDVLVAGDSGEHKTIKEIFYSDIGLRVCVLPRMPAEGLPVKHFLLIYVLTFGLYIYFWFLANYRQFKNYKGLEMNPELRALAFFALSIFPNFIFGAVIGKIHPESMFANIGQYFFLLIEGVQIVFLYFLFQMMKIFLDERLKKPFMPFVVLSAFFIIITITNLISLDTSGYWGIYFGSLFIQAGILSLVQRDLNIFWRMETRDAAKANAIR